MTQKKPFIFFKTTPAVGNTGEVLIYRSLLLHIRSHGKIIINDRPKYMQAFLKEMQILSTEKLSFYTKKPFLIKLIFQAFLYPISRQKVIFITGVGEHKYVTLTSAIKNFFASFALFFFKILGIRIIRIGMSMELTGFLPKKSELFLSKFVDYYFVRDSISLRRCHLANIKKAQQAPDLSWAYSIQSMNQRSSVSPTKHVFFAFRQSLLRSPQEENSFFLLLTQIARNFTKQKFSITCVHQVEQDWIFTKKIFDHLVKAKIHNIYLEETQITLANASLYYPKASFVFSNRLHVLLFCYKFGALPQGIIHFSRQTKIVGIFKDFDALDLLFDYSVHNEYKIPTPFEIEQQMEKIKITEYNNKKKLEELIAKTCAI